MSSIIQKRVGSKGLSEVFSFKERRDTGKHWNSLPLSVFPHAYDLNSFKRGCIKISLMQNWNPMSIFLLLFSLHALATSGIFLYLFFFL